MDKPPDSNWTEMDCRQCDEQLPGTIARVLESDGTEPDGPVHRHLVHCPHCARAYLDLLELETGPDLHALRQSLTGRGPAPSCLNGLLALWRLAAGLYNLLDDRKGSADSLSVVGMIHRQQGRLEEAARDHELALDTGGSLWGEMVSCTDLGYLAQRRGQEREARRYLDRALRAARWLEDEDGQEQVVELRTSPRRPARAGRLSWPVLQRVAVGAMAAVSVLVSVLWSLWPGETPLPPGPVVASVVGLASQTKVRRAQTGRKVAASVGMPLYAGDTIDVREGMTATVRYGDKLMVVSGQTVLPGTGEELVGPQVVALSVDALPDRRLPEVAQPADMGPITELVLGSEQDEPSPAAPRLLGPLQATIADAQPTICWEPPVTEAQGYVLTTAVPGAILWSRPVSGTCLAFPYDAPPLPPGPTGIVVTLCQEGVGDEDERISLIVLDETERQELREAARALESLPVDDLARQTLVFHLYRERGMAYDALEQVQRLVREADRASPYLYQQLGDLYVEFRQIDDAYQAYQSALGAARGARDAGAQALARDGLARTAYLQGNAREAQRHLRRAESLYRRVGQVEQAERAAEERAGLED